MEIQTQWFRTATVAYGYFRKITKRNSTWFAELGLINGLSEKGGYRFINVSVPVGGSVKKFIDAQVSDQHVYDLITSFGPEWQFEISGLELDYDKFRRTNLKNYRGFLLQANPMNFPTANKQD